MASNGALPQLSIAARDEVLAELEAFERENRRRDAHRLELLARLLRGVLGCQGGTSELAYRSLRLEVATALGQSEHAAECLLDTAWVATERYPGVCASLRQGEISLEHVRVIVDAGGVLHTGHSDDAARLAAYEAEVLPFAAEETPARLRPIARRLAAVQAQSTLTERHREALQRRSVRVVDADDGMADLIAHLSAEEAYAVKDRLTRIAVETAAAVGVSEAAAAGTSGGSPTGAGPADRAASPVRPRSRDEVRADALCDLLLERPGATTEIARRVRAQVQLVVPGEVVGLAGAGGVPELIGHGPIDPETAAGIAGSAEAWERIAVSAAGEVLTVDRYRPTLQMRRHLAARDLHCRAPGCRVPANRCDIDHTVDAARGGPTSTENLAHLCRGHHTLKHHTEWTVSQEPGGVMRWRTPTGREVVEKPPSRVRFRHSRPEERAG